MVSHNLIKGSTFEDERGILNFFNTFKMDEIVRLYEIAPTNSTTIRAWQGHKHENKWFYCNSGSFVINLVEINDFENVSDKLKSQRFILDAKEPSVLEISGGYATGFKALEEGSKLLVFSNFSVNKSKEDDFRFKADYWAANW